MWLSVDEKNSSVVKSFKKDDNVVVTSSGNIKTITSANSFIGVSAGDWVIIADAAIVKNQNPWTEKVLEAGNDYIKVCQQGPNSIDDGQVTLVSDDNLVVVRCSIPPQKVSISSWSSFEELVKYSSSGLSGVLVSTVGTSTQSRKLSFKSAKYDVFAYVKVLCITPAMATLLGLAKDDKQEVVVGIYPKYSLDSYSDIAFPTFLYKKGTPSSSNCGEVFKSITTEENSSVGGYLYSTDQGLVKTYRDTDWNQKLNAASITNDAVTSYTGFQFGGSDSIDLLIDGERDDSYSMSLAMYKKAYLTSGGLGQYKIEGLSGEPSITQSISSIDLSDFALWTAPVSSALDSANETVTFTSKTVGKDSLYKRAELVYATSPNQSCSDSVSDGVVKITIASGASRNPTGQNNTVYVRSDSEQSNVVYLEYAPKWYYHGSPNYTDENYFYCSADPANDLHFQDLPRYVSVGDIITCTGDLFGTTSVTAVTTYSSGGEIRWKISVQNGLTPTNGDGPYPISIGNESTTLGTAVVGDKLSFSIDGGQTVMVGRITNVSSFGTAVLAMESSYSPPTYDRFASSPNIQAYPNNPSAFTDGTYSYVSAENVKQVYAGTLSTLDKNDFGNIEDEGVFSSGVNYISQSEIVDNGTKFGVSVKSSTVSPTVGDCTIVPVTSKNVSDFINGAYGNRGFSSCVSSQRKVELTRDEAGADRSIQVTGGSGNSVSFKVSYIVDEKTIKTSLSSLSVTVGSGVTLSQSLPTKMLFREISGTIHKTTGLVELDDFPTDFGGYFWNLWDWNNSTYGSARSNRNMDKILAWNLPWKVIVDGDYVGFVLDKGSLLNQYNTDTDVDFSTLWSQVRVGSMVRVQPARFPLGTKDGSTFYIENYYRVFGAWKSGSTVKNYTTNTSATISSIDVEADEITFSGDVSSWQQGQLIGPDDSLDTSKTGLYRVLSVDRTNYVFWIKNGTTASSKWSASTKASFTTIFYATNSALEGDSFRYNGFTTSLDSFVDRIPTDFVSLASLKNNNSMQGKSDARSRIYIKNPPSGDIAIESVNNDTINFVKSSTVSVIDTIESILPTGSKDEYLVSFKNAGTQNQKDNPSVKGVYSFQRLFDSSQSSSQSVGVSSSSKLSFSNSTLYGNDAYNYYTGLIGEANRIVFGDAQDPLKYSGFASLNASVEILPPNIKQVKVGLLVRMLAGYSLRDVVQNVQSAVTSFVNATPIGQNVPYSGIIASASLVAGVQSVVVNDLNYGIPNTSTQMSDVISVMSDEKPLVLSLTDITVTQI
jgi:hypothetical protein